MNVTKLFSSSVGKKFVMALTGLLLFGFVVGHMVGNLQFFLGPDAINRYGHFLQSNIELLWPARIILLAVVATHIWSAIKLSAENKAARPVPYANEQTVAASYASRTMLMSGLIILSFIIYHLLHFTVMLDAINFTGKSFASLVDKENHHDIFAMMVIGFKNPFVSGFYIIAQFLLFLHLGHGVSALFQSLGFKTPGVADKIDLFARGASWLLFAGFCAIPISVMVFGYGSEYVKEVLK